VPCLSLSCRECDRKSGGIAYRVNDSHDRRAIIRVPAVPAKS
jgi:hypothetical protein